MQKSQTCDNIIYINTHLMGFTKRTGRNKGIEKYLDKKGQSASNFIKSIYSSKYFLKEGHHSQAIKINLKKRFEEFQVEGSNPGPAQ